MCGTKPDAIHYFLLILGEPNNNSPLNTQAATLWANQAVYKRMLHEKYEAEANNQDGMMIMNKTNK